jgi:membrane protein DedA with SNARE-associated domain
MRRYGKRAIIIQKFLYGVKTLVPLVMGMGKFPFSTFIFYNAFASILFVTVIALSGYFAGDTVTALFENLRRNPWIAPLFIVLFGTAVWLLVTKLSKKD